MRKQLVAFVSLSVSLYSVASYAGSAGTGLPSGSHYNLNIIGVPKGKSADMTGNNGRRIFVNESGKTTINLLEGDFQVLDANGTDGKAIFQLPDPVAGDGLTAKYSVYARALGKPGGSASQTTCATEIATGDYYCSVDSAVYVSHESSKFTNVSKYLLSMFIDLDGDGDGDKVVPLFSDGYQDFLWEYDNSGLKLLQLRFYNVPSDLSR
jgi:hypothetical protein